MRQAEHAVCLLVISVALCTGQDRVIVGHHHAARTLWPELLGIDRANARHHAICRRVGDQILQAAPACLRRNRQCTVFNEAAVITQLGNVLACRASALCMALFNCRLAVFIKREGMAIDHTLQIGTHRIQIKCLLYLPLRTSMFARLQHHQPLALGQGLSRLTLNAHHSTGLLSQQDMLHFHGFQNCQFGALSHNIASRYPHLHQTRRHGHAGQPLPRGQIHCRPNALPQRHITSGDLCAAAQRSLAEHFGRSQQFGQGLLDKASVNRLDIKSFVGCYGLQQRQIGDNTLDVALCQGAARAATDVFKTRTATGDDQFGQQGVVVR